MQRQARFGLALLAIPLVIVLLAVSAWAIDSASNSGQVPRNTTLAGRDIGTSTATEAREIVAEVATEMEGRAVVVTTDAGTFETTASEIGLEVDEEATVDAAMSADEEDASLLRPIGWLMSFGDPYRAELRWELDRARMAAGLSEARAAFSSATTRRPRKGASSATASARNSRSSV